MTDAAADFGRRLAQDGAEIDEVLLRGLALGAVCAAPLVDELLGRHAGRDLAAIRTMWNAIPLAPRAPSIHDPSGTSDPFVLSSAKSQKERDE
jgi:hypothetical protein